MVLTSMQSIIGVDKSINHLLLLTLLLPSSSFITPRLQIQFFSHSSRRNTPIHAHLEEKLDLDVIDSQVAGQTWPSPDQIWLGEGQIDLTAAKCGRTTTTKKKGWPCGPIRQVSSHTRPPMARCNRHGACQYRGGIYYYYYYFKQI